MSVWSRRAEIAFAQPSTRRFLPWLIAVMVLLGAMALAGALALGAMTVSWDDVLRGRVTVQVPRSAAPDAPVLDEIVRLVATAPGVVSALPLDDAQTATMLAPWLGADIAAADLPIPHLIDVTIVDDGTFATDALITRLQEIAPGVSVDDHRVWLGDMVRLVRTVQILGYVTVLLIGFCAVSAVIFATRSELAIHQQVVELLHLIGARDGYIARQFQLYALRLCLRGAFVGAFAMVAMLAAVIAVGRDLDTLLVPPIRFAPWHWAVLAAVPVAAPLIALVTARLTVMRSLVGMA